MSKNQFETAQNNLFELLDRISPYFILNMGWFGLSLFIVTLIPATGGLYYATHKLAHEGDAGLTDLWHGFRTYFWLSWWWAGLNIVILGTLIGNVLFYANFEGAWTVWVRGAFLMLMILWLHLQIYMFPMLIEQTDKRLRTAVRNSVLLFAARPIRTIGWGLLLGAMTLTAVFFYPSWAIISASLLLYLSNWAAKSALAHLDAISSTSAGASNSTPP